MKTLLFFGLALALFSCMNPGYSNLENENIRLKTQIDSLTNALAAVKLYAGKQAEFAVYRTALADKASKEQKNAYEQLQLEKERLRLEKERLLIENRELENKYRMLLTRCKSSQ